MKKVQETIQIFCSTCASCPTSGSAEVLPAGNKRGWQISLNKAISLADEQKLKVLLYHFKIGFCQALAQFYKAATSCQEEKSLWLIITSISLIIKLAIVCCHL